MENVFLSFHYDKIGRDLANTVENLIINHGFNAVTGERSAGGGLAEEIKAKIDGCDALICLFTEREDDLNRDWVRDERAYADAKGKRIITLVQSGSSDGGFFGAYKRIDFDPQAPLPAVLDLSGTLGSWRREGGRFVTALLEPSDLAREHAHDQNAEVSFRCWERERPSEWRPAPRQKTGHKETLVFLKGVPETALIEVKLAHNGKVWESGAQQQHVNIRLEDEE